MLLTASFVRGDEKNWITNRKEIQEKSEIDRCHVGDGAHVVLALEHSHHLVPLPRVARVPHVLQPVEVRPRVGVVHLEDLSPPLPQFQGWSRFCACFQSCDTKFR